MLDKKLLAILACPLCKGSLHYQHGGSHDGNQSAEELICYADGLAFPVRDGIPVMLDNEARQLTLEEKERR